ncbi:MAG TPA: hypothetical protein VHL79_01195 [Ramlibacter sp.]|jgi:uncharacterized membrane protein|nr:hypothetical protein [Ramlibacter sp.]
MIENFLQELKRMDAERDNIPGEHWLTFAAGVGLWLATRRHPSVTVRLLASLAGTLLVARAATGREVPKPLARLPFSGRPRKRTDWIG